MNKRKCGGVCGTAVVGSKGQIVIPKEARDKLKLKPGDRFLVLEHMGRLVLLPETMMKEIVEEFTAHFK